MNEASTILIVDDNKENLKVVGNILKEQNYRIAFALDGNSAIKLLSENKIDLILLDIMMPEIDGFEVCRQLKMNHKLYEIPVIFLTAKNQTEDIITAFEVGGVDYLTKPFNKLELLARVKTHLELSISKRRIVELNKNRDFIYSVIAHDIRSPFNKIQQVVSMLEQGFIKPDSKEFKELIGLLSKQSEDTINLINNLIEWTKMLKDGDNILLENNNIHKLVESLFLFLLPIANSKSIILKNHIPENTFATFESKSLNIVIRNLISNAIKFTNQNGEVSVSFQEKGNNSSIIISDNGVGMSNEAIERIFSKNEYYTTYGTNKEKGTGLGLQIVKDFVKRNKGKILVESTEGYGTKFTILLPKNH
ncbi:MAG: hybrid sensor histidine kinase/response regulator [Bacteroidales bacterium]|nr:hybrid sensor histidine kinase/response regulator [Bacteroidales bacterium]